jgi:hypothetical protein
MLPVLASLAGVAAVTTRGSAATPPSPLVGRVYVNDNNTSCVNAIGAFNRHADGTLTPIPGSPFGRGSRKPGEDALTRGAATEHRRPLPVGSRSRQQRDLGAAIEPDGSLELVGDGPVCSNGVNPVSIAIHGQLVYVDNAGTPTSSGQTNQPWDFDETQPDQYPLLLQFPSFELYRKQVVKQADLVLCTGAAMRSARRRRPATSPTTRPLRSETPRFRRVRRR